MKHFLLLLGCLPLTLHAQHRYRPARATQDEPAQVSRVHFGASLGANLTHMNFNRGYPKPATPINTSWKPGIAVGALVQVPIYGRFSFQQEYLFSQMGSQLKDSGLIYRLAYLSLPTTLRVRVLPRLALLAGPQFDLLIKAQTENNNQTIDITHDTEERSVGTTAGLEYYLLPQLSLNARYLHGFNHVGIGQRSAVQEFKYEMVQLVVSVKL